MKKNAYTTVPERFLKPYQIPKEKLDKAIKEALEKLEKNMPRWKSGFVYAAERVGKGVNVYKEMENKSWVHGMNTGIYWLAYELSGDEKFKAMAENMLPSYQYRLDNKIGFGDHDVGFVYSPSCVAAYKKFGHTELKDMLLEAVDYYYKTGIPGKVVLSCVSGKVRILRSAVER